MQKDVRKEMKKEKWIADKCTSIEDNLSKNISKVTYNIGKELICENKG